MKNFLSLIPFSYPWIIRHHLGNAKTVLDVGCGDGSLILKINADKKYKVTGLDLYKPYLDKAKKTGLYKDLAISDLRKLKFMSKAFDAVLASQVIEHISKKEGLNLIKKMQKIARKKVIICTPNGFVPFDPFEANDRNPLQVHKSGWDISEMQKFGYNVFGQGAAFIYRPTGLLYRFRFFKYIWVIVSLLLAPLVYFYPNISSIIICVKNEEN